MTFQLIETGHSSLRMNITCKISSNTSVSCGHHKSCLVCLCFFPLYVCVCIRCVCVHVYVVYVHAVCVVCLCAWGRGMHVWTCLHVESRSLGRKSPTITLPPYSLRPCLSATPRVCRPSWSWEPTVSAFWGWNCRQAAIPTQHLWGFWGSQLRPHTAHKHRKQRAISLDLAVLV